MAREEAEITTALTYLEVYQGAHATDASKAQLLFIQNYPQMAAQLTQIVRGMI